MNKKKIVDSTMMEQIKRITEMEAKFDKGLQAVDELSRALESFAAAVPEIEELISYYESESWRQDFEDDRNGKLPADLKRGILSEDGIYDLLTDYQRLKLLMDESNGREQNEFEDNA